MGPPPVRVEVGEASVSVRTPSAHVINVLAGATFALIGLSMLSAMRPLGWGSGLLGVVLLVFGIWAAVDAALARLLLTEVELVERGDLRRRRIPTDQIRAFSIDRTPHVVPWTSLWVELESGASVPLEQTRVFGPKTGYAARRLGAAATTMNDWLAARR